MFLWEFPIKSGVHFPRKRVIHSTLALRKSCRAKRWGGKTPPKHVHPQEAYIDAGTQPIAEIHMEKITHRFYPAR